MASSLAFWFETKNGHNDTDLQDVDTELHFNYWSLKSINTNYLDVGIHISSHNSLLTNSVKALKIFLPFKTNEMEFDPSLGALVCDDKTLLAAIFNSHILSTRSEDSSGVLNITLPDGKNFDFYTHIEESSDDGIPGVEIRSFNDTKQPGTILTFPVELFTQKHTQRRKSTGKRRSKPKISNPSVSYFRFRIKLSHRQNSLSTIFKPKASSITSQFEETQIIDFRVNEARILPLKIREQMQRNSCLSKVHFFLVREASAEYKAAHSEFKRCRVLESEIWDKYLDQKNNTAKQHMLIYHWVGNKKDEKAIDHFSAFSKFSSTTVTDMKVLAMVFFLVTLGVLSGIIANKIWSELIKTETNEISRGSPKTTNKGHCYPQQYFPIYGKYAKDTIVFLPNQGECDG